MPVQRQSLKPYVGGQTYAIAGMAGIVRNLNKQVNAIKTRTLRGLIRAQAKVRSDMDNVPPLIPVDTGNLRNSQFVVTSTPAIIVGPTAFDNRDGLAKRLTTDHITVINQQLRAAELQGKTKGPTVIFGFTAYYAVYVHELMKSLGGKAINWTRKNSGPKFFQAALYRNRNHIMRIIRSEAKGR